MCFQLLLSTSGSNLFLFQNSQGAPGRVVTLIRRPNKEVIDHRCNLFFFLLYLLTSFSPLTAQCVTWGVAYKIAKDKVDQVLAYLDYREKVHSIVPLCVAGWHFSEHSFLPILSTRRVAIPENLSIFIHTKAVSSLLLLGLAWALLFNLILLSSLLLLLLSFSRIKTFFSYLSNSCIPQALLYRATEDNPEFLGRAPLYEIAAQIHKSVGTLTAHNTCV